MDEGLVIEPMSTEDLDEVISLLGYVVNTKARSYFEWKYRGTPQDQLLVVRDTSTCKVVGFNALVPCRIKFDLVVYEAVQSVDLVVHPEYRRRGIMYSVCTQLYENAMRNGSRFAIGWTARGLPAWRGFVYKLDWLDLGLMPDLLYPLKPFRAVSRLGYGKIISNVLGLLLWLWKRVRRVEKKPKGNLVVEIDVWDYPGLWQCWRESLERDTVAIERNPDFYARRFSRTLEEPHEFHPITVKENGKIVSYAICITYESDQGSVGMIADLHSQKDKLEALQLVVGTCVNHFKSEGVDFIRLWGKKPKWIRKAMSKYGFIGHIGNQSFRVRRLGEGPPSHSPVLSFRNWALDLCDSDHV